MWKGMLFVQPKSQTHSWSWHGHACSHVSTVVAADTPLFSLHLALSALGLSGSRTSSSALHTCFFCVCSSQEAAESHLHALHPPLVAAVFLGGSCRILEGLAVRQPSFDHYWENTRWWPLSGPVKQMVCALPVSSGDSCVRREWMWSPLTLSENLSAA